MNEITPRNPIIPVSVQGDEGWIRFTVTGEGGEEVEWTSSRPEVASIDPDTGLVTAHAAGTTEISTSAGVRTHLTVVEGEYDFEKGEDMLILGPDGSLYLLAKNAWQSGKGQVTRIEHRPDFVDDFLESGEVGAFEPLHEGDGIEYVACYVLNLAHIPPKAE